MYNKIQIKEEEKNNHPAAFDLSTAPFSNFMSLLINQIARRVDKGWKNKEDGVILGDEKQKRDLQLNHSSKWNQKRIFNI